MMKFQDLLLYLVPLHHYQSYPNKGNEEIKYPPQPNPTAEIEIPH